MEDDIIEIEVFKFRKLPLIVIIENMITIIICLKAAFTQSLLLFILGMVFFLIFGSLRSYFQMRTIGKVQIINAEIYLNIKGISRKINDSDKIIFYFKESFFKLNILGKTGSELRYFNLYNKGGANSWDRVVINEIETYQLKLISKKQYKYTVDKIRSIEVNVHNVKVIFEP